MVVTEEAEKLSTSNAIDNGVAYCRDFLMEWVMLYDKHLIQRQDTPFRALLLLG